MKGARARGMIYASDLFCRLTRMGLAIHKEEYVPHVTPMAKITQNSLMVVPPKNIREQITKSVVMEVLMVLTMV